MNLHRSALVLAVLSLNASALLPAQPISPEPAWHSGTYRGRPIQFRIVHGWAVDGDIILGRPEQLINPAVAVPPAPNNLWPKVGNLIQVPYTNANGNPAVEAAVKIFNTYLPNFIQIVKRTTEADYIQFNVTDDGSNGCGGESPVGRVGGPQEIPATGGSQVCPSVLLHEIGHSLGFHHEQTRSDRKDYVKANWWNITDRSQYDPGRGQADVGLYDYASIMHYERSTFARDTTDTTMDTIPAGIPLRAVGAWSAGDLDALQRLYSAPPTAVTISTNPPGLQISVDGQVVVTGTPQATFNWALNSQHVLDVPGNLQNQTQNGVTYAFARWNDVNVDTPVRHTIVLTPGDGSTLYPATAPRITQYTAHFAQVVSSAGLFTTAASPQNGGTVAITPDPTDIGTSVSSYQAFQDLKVTATPNLGFNFYDWQFDGKTPVLSGERTRNLRPTMTQSVTARFTQNPVTTVTTNPPRLPITVDGTNYTSPKNFSGPDFDAAWTPGSSHSISVASPLASIKEDPKERLGFIGWSDNGAQTHNVTAGASTIYIANFAIQYQLSVSMARLQDNSGQVCSPATITLNPTSPDAFYNAGSVVTATVQPNPGWVFLGWRGAATGNDNPLAIAMDKTRSLQAQFNTTNAPFAITSIAPATAPLNGTDFTLTVTGTGFAPNTTYCFYDQGASSSNVCGNVTYGGPTTVSVPVTAAMLAKPQTMVLWLYNSPDGQCSATATVPVKVQ